jgi:hypothetical protein
METKIETKWMLVAGIIALAGIGCAFFFSSPEGPSPSWIQAGAAIALIIITWRYVILTQRILLESEKARLESIIPRIVVRSRKCESQLGFPLAETFLLNAGTGTAVRIELVTSISYPLNHDITSDVFERHPKVTGSFQGALRKKNDALNSSYGSIESRITLLEQNLDVTDVPAIGNPKLGVFILYEDTIGRGYYTLYLHTEHILGSIYTADTSSERKTAIRKALMRLGSLSDVAKLVREHGSNFPEVLYSKGTSKEKSR